MAQELIRPTLASPSPWPIGAATCWYRKSLPYALLFHVLVRCIPSASTHGLCCLNTCMRYGHCRRATPIFRRDGPSSSAVSRQDLRRVKADLPPELPKESEVSGSGGFGNTRCVVRMILRDMSIMSTSTPSSMVWSATPRIGRSHHFGAPWPAGITRSIGETEKRLVENSVKDRTAEGR